MSQYNNDIATVTSVCAEQGESWNAINPESVARMRAQNRFQTGLDVAKYTAKIMREDMAAYDGDSSKYTQSLGCWHGFIAQQKMIAIDDRPHITYHYSSTKSGARSSMPQ